MFHGMFPGETKKHGKQVNHDMFTICSFNSPDLDGHRAPKTNREHQPHVDSKNQCTRNQMSVGKFLEVSRTRRTRLPSIVQHPSSREMSGNSIVRTLAKWYQDATAKELKKYGGCSAP